MAPIEIRWISIGALSILAFGDVERIVSFAEALIIENVDYSGSITSKE